MADRFELVAIGLPLDSAPESLPACIAEFIAACWNGMSRAQLLDRARRLALRASLRALKEPAIAGPEGVRRHVLCWSRRTLRSCAWCAVAGRGARRHHCRRPGMHGRGTFLALWIVKVHGFV